MAFRARRPGAWLRDDIADILTALAHDTMRADAGPGDEYTRGRGAALLDVATALGITWQWTADDRAKLVVVVTDKAGGP